MRNYKKHGDLVYSVLLSCFFIFYKQLKQDETKESKGMKLMYLSETHRHCTMNLEPTERRYGVFDGCFVMSLRRVTCSDADAASRT